MPQHDPFDYLESPADMAALEGNPLAMSNFDLVSREREAFRLYSVSKSDAHRVAWVALYDELIARKLSIRIDY